MTSDSIFLKSLKNDNGKVTRALTNKESGNLQSTQKLKGDAPPEDQSFGNGEPSLESTIVSSTTNEMVEDERKEVKKHFKGQQPGTKGYVKGEA